MKPKQLKPLRLWAWPADLAEGRMVLCDSKRTPRCNRRIFRRALPAPMIRVAVVPLNDVEGLIVKLAAAQEIAGGMRYFTMAQAGRDAFAAYQATLPPPPKLTRSQIRYRRFLSADCGMKFSEWLKWETWSNRRAES